MNHSTGNGNGPSSTSKRPAKAELTQAQVGATLTEVASTQITFQSADGVTRRGGALAVSRHNLVFELYRAEEIPQFSELLKDFKVVSPAGTLYTGPAVVDNLVDDGIRITCEVKLDELAWADCSIAVNGEGKGRAHAGFSNFLKGWQKAYAVKPEYKVAISDLQTFMNQLRLWLQQAELKISQEGGANHERIANEIVMELRPPVIKALNSLYEPFEVVSSRISPDVLPAHRAYGRQQLHPLILSSPFMHRTYTKPLGYAGDYEMMNMIVRNGLEGQSLFAKLINSHLLDQPPCQAVRNRVHYLQARILEETARKARSGGTANIFCVACGPAWEATNFVVEHPLSDSAAFELLDFNEETLERTGKKIANAIQKNQRRTRLKMTKNSVQNLLRSRGRRAGEFDMIYCSGLYDYLSDSVCQALNDQLYQMLAPGGLLVVGNFATGTPGRNLMEHLMDWFLIYRTPRELMALAPTEAGAENSRVRSETAAANLFLEARKPQ